MLVSLSFLQAQSNTIRPLIESGQLSVLSFGEGVPTVINSLLPKLLVVPEESANPGFGDFVYLKGIDHINVCKPLDRTDPAYAHLQEFLKARIAHLNNSAPERTV